MSGIDARRARPFAPRVGRWLLVLLVAVAGCSRRAPNATPDGAVRELVERLRRVEGDPADAKAAFALLSRAARENLGARAQRYAAAIGKPIAPEAMITPSRFVLRFEPQRYSARIAGASAAVEVTGLLPEQRAVVPVVYEDGGWRVDAVLPPLPPVQTRPGSTPP